MSDRTTTPPQRLPEPSRDARVEALRAMNKRLTMAENAGLAAVSKLAQIVQIVGETREDVNQNHRHVMDAINRIGAQVGQLYEAVVVQEGRIGALEQKKSERNGHADAE